MLLVPGRSEIRVTIHPRTVSAAFSKHQSRFSSRVLWKFVELRAQQQGVGYEKGYHSCGVGEKEREREREIETRPQSNYIT